MSVSPLPQPPPADGYQNQVAYNEAGQSVEFRGKLIASITTETLTKSRWTELYIYRTLAGTYVYWRVGRTVVFHKAGADGCERGSIVERDTHQLSNFDPCTRCNPTREDASVRIENDINTLSTHSSPAELIRAMATFSPISRGSSHMSGPALDLLNDAASKDPGIKAAMDTPIRII